MDPFDFFNSDSESSEDEIYDCSSSSNSDITTDMSFNYDHSVPKSPEVSAKAAFPKNIVKKLMQRETHGFFSPFHNLRHFDKVPAENCLRLSEILPKTYPRQQHVCMGLTRCGNFLITYTLQPEMGVNFDENYHYQLHWWRFVPHRRCVKLSSTQLFQSRTVDVELHITVCQWPGDNSRLLVYGFEMEAEQAGGSGRAHVSVLTVPAVARCADCQGASPEPRVESDRDGPCLRHGLTVHASFDHGAPCPPFNAKLSLKRDGLVIINIGHLLHVLDIRLDSADQQPAAPAPPITTAAVLEPLETEAVWSDDENALLRMLDQNFLDVNHELSIACADYDDPAYRIRDGPDSPEEARLPEKQPRLGSDSRSVRDRDREESRDRRPRRFAHLADAAARPPRAETIYEFCDDDESCERLSDLRRRRLADKRYAFSEDDCEDAENIVPYRRCTNKQCDRLLSPQRSTSPQPPANRTIERLKATPSGQVSTSKGLDRLKATPSSQVSANKGLDRMKTIPPGHNKARDRLKSPPPNLNKMCINKTKSPPHYDYESIKSPLNENKTRLKSPPPNPIRACGKMKSPPYYECDDTAPLLSDNKSMDRLKSPPPNSKCYENIRSPPFNQTKSRDNLPAVETNRNRILSPPPNFRNRDGLISPQPQAARSYANVRSPPCNVNRGGGATVGGPKQYGNSGRSLGQGRGRFRSRTSPPLLSPPLGSPNGSVLRPVNSNGSQPAQKACANADLARPAPEALLPVAGRPATATGKYTTLFDRHYVERDSARPPDPQDNDEEDGEAPAYQFALLMVVLGARNEPMQLATPKRPGKPGAARVIVGQKSLDCEQFLNDVGEAVCADMGLLFSHCVDYHLDISDVCPVTGEALCEARLRLKFSLRQEQRCRLGDCACIFVLHADTGTVGVVSVSSLVQAGFEGRESCQLRAPPRGPLGPALPSAGRVRFINNEGTLRYVSYSSLVDLENLIEIRL